MAFWKTWSNFSRFLKTVFCCCRSCSYRKTIIMILPFQFCKIYCIFPISSCKFSKKRLFSSFFRAFSLFSSTLTIFHAMKHNSASGFRRPVGACCRRVLLSSCRRPVFLSSYFRRFFVSCRPVMRVWSSLAQKALLYIAQKGASCRGNIYHYRRKKSTGDSPGPPGTGL